jgi:hypothetical protein
MNSNEAEVDRHKLLQDGEEREVGALVHFMAQTKQNTNTQSATAVLEQSSPPFRRDSPLTTGW